MNELYLPPVAPRWARTRDLVAALGCSVVRADRGRWVGDAPQDAQLLRGGRIYFPAGERLSSRAWAHIAHEAVHNHAGKWSLEDEQPMLPFELELSRRIANTADRRACYRYLRQTALCGLRDIDGEPWRYMIDLCYVGELVAAEGAEWTVSPLWTGIREECERKRLPMDGRLRGESPTR